VCISWTNKGINTIKMHGAAMMSQRCSLALYIFLSESNFKCLRFLYLIFTCNQKVSRTAIPLLSDQLHAHNCGISLIVGRGLLVASVITLFSVLSIILSQLFLSCYYLYDHEHFASNLEAYFKCTVTNSLHIITSVFL